jgi:RNA polymerase sigma factor for flagellar operon FliA
MKDAHPRADLASLWTSYKDHDDPDSRERLILNYSPLVKYVAGRLSANLPQNVENADLISYGIFGLIDAIEKFEPDRGIKFETYAIARIKGAIIDELRSLDWVPRSVRSRGREIENVYVTLETRLRRSPTDPEVATELGITVKELRDTFAKLSYTSVASFEELWAPGGEKDERSSLMATIADDRAEDPVTIFETEEIKTILATAIERLPERERLVIALYYYEGLTLKEIGEVLGVAHKGRSAAARQAPLGPRIRSLAVTTE